MELQWRASLRFAIDVSSSFTSDQASQGRGHTVLGKMTTVDRADAKISSKYTFRQSRWYHLLYTSRIPFSHLRPLRPLLELYLYELLPQKILWL